ncbi:MAG: tetratricopeptide repeat protein [Desulfobacterales bacterium]|nr:MAG: tetratricopeptide repeat protein [Desulfobacterales bacterium]
MIPWKIMISGGTVSADTTILRTGWLVAAFAICICLFPVYSYPSSAVLLDPDRQFQFAEQYFHKGEYYRAIGEYERFIHFFPDSEGVELARHRIGSAYLRGERYEEAIEVFRDFTEKYPTSRYTLESYLGISQAYVKLRRYDAAIINLENLITIAPNQDVKDEAYYQCGWVYLEKGLWDNAQVCFNKISPQNREKYKLEQFLQELDKKTQLKRKNPAAAGLFAIVPGAGHLYCERYGDALVSFLVNGALIFAAYEAFDHDQNALGVIVTLFEVGFYSGNIYSAVNSAHKYNRRERNRFLRYLEEHSRIKISLAGPRHDTTVLLSYQMSF